MARLVLVFVLLFRDARSHNFLCLPPFFNLQPFAEREKTHLNIQFLLLPMAGIKPGPPAQQASVHPLHQSSRDLYNKVVFV